MSMFRASYIDTKLRQTKKLEPDSDSMGSEAALVLLSGEAAHAKVHATGDERAP
jgi:hypothetical protein